MKKFDNSLSLGLLFVAVQLVDFVFLIFLQLGIEQAAIVPGFTEVNAYQLINLPFSHSLLGSIIWAGLTVIIVRYVVFKNSSKKTYAAALVGIAVISHYVLDFLVHTPDLLIIPGLDVKIGLGLWNSLPLTILAELAMLLGGVVLYYIATSESSSTQFFQKYGLPLFAGLLIILTISTPFIPDPASLLEFSASGLFFYVFLAGIAFQVDKTRRARSL